MLLRSEPAPQSTVEPAPSRVRLEFSEPVETAFGAVRVYDVDGRRVDRGTVRRAGALVDAPVEDLADGTYTVSWRVLSSDGHRIRGGFVFYVTAPSTISPAAIEEDTGAGPLVGWGFGVVRFLWFGALLTIIGSAVARRFVWTPALAHAGLTATPAAGRFRAGVDRALLSGWVVLMVAGGASIVFQAATAAGLSLPDAAAVSVLDEVLQTAYGKAWLAQTALALLALAPVLALRRRRAAVFGAPAFWLAVLGVLSVGLCITAAVSGHARTDANPLLAETSIVVHLLAVAVWVGGLGALVVLGGPAWRSLPDDDRGPVLRDLVARFNRVAVVAVAVVLATGTLNSVAAMAGPSDLWDTPYGRVVAAKVLLLAVAMALAARHRVRNQRSFERTSGVELLALVAAVALAAALVALVPGRSLALAEGGPVSAERRAGPYTVQLFVDPSAVGANEVHVTFVDDGGLAAAEVTTAAVTLTPPGGRARALAVRLIAPGHFAGDTTLPAPGSYRLDVRTTAGGGASTQFRFTIARRD